MSTNGPIILSNFTLVGVSGGWAVPGGGVITDKTKAYHAAQYYDDILHRSLITVGCLSVTEYMRQCAERIRR